MFTLPVEDALLPYLNQPVVLETPEEYSFFGNDGKNSPVQVLQDSSGSVPGPSSKPAARPLRVISDAQRQQAKRRRKNPNAEPKLCPVPGCTEDFSTIGRVGSKSTPFTLKPFSYSASSTLFLKSLIPPICSPYKRIPFRNQGLCM
jgi:hypothetical protein